MDLPDDYFRDKSPADIIAKVATITLANISLMGETTLRRIGWLDNPIVDILYSVTSAGVWIANVDSSGYKQVADQNTLNQTAISTYLNSHPTYNAGYHATSGVALNSKLRTAIIAINTDGSGNAAAAAMITGPAGYYPICRLKTIHSSVAEATTQLLFTVTGGALVGPTRMDFNLAAYVTQEIGGAHGQLMFNLTDASIINVAVNSGPISALIQIEMEYWYET